MWWLKPVYSKTPSPGPLAKRAFLLGIPTCGGVSSTDQICLSRPESALQPWTTSDSRNRLNGDDDRKQHHRKQAIGDQASVQTLAHGTTVANRSFEVSGRTNIPQRRESRFRLGADRHGEHMNRALS